MSEIVHFKKYGYFIILDTVGYIISLKGYTNF